MDINDILADLGLDLSNPDVKRGALEAIDAILTSRMPPMSLGGGGGAGGMSGTMDVEIDPDLIQPSQKHQPEESNDDIEIEDEEDLLSKVKRNDSEVDITGNSSGTDLDASNDSSSSSNTSDSEESTSGADDSSTDDSEAEMSDKANTSTSSSNTTNSDEDTEASEEDNTNAENGVSEEESEEESDEASGEAGELEDEDENSEDDEFKSAKGEGEEDALASEEDSILDDEETDFELEDEDLLDDTLKDTYDNLDIKSKQEARRIKRERTLQAAKKALIDAKAKRVSKNLIHELESAIAALEELTEAVKSLKDVSDDEFNRLINRVFDAIDAVGDKSLTFTSDEERELQAQEIKTDLANSKTQAELSAEDVAQIRAENQAIKARDQEANKYKARARSSFKGFQEFLNSLYRAIALQVHIEDTKDDTWSAINRRHSGSGVLQPGQRIQDLPNRKIPIIDFYFDCSGSWDDRDVAVGQEAVKKLTEMEEDGKIKINIYYFSNHVHTDAETARDEGGTAAWNDIVKNVISTQATNVIIMTDDDMETWWEPGDQPPLRYTVPGYVWYLWRDGENAPRLTRDLKGRGGVQQFSFSRGDV